LYQSTSAANIELGKFILNLSNSLHNMEAIPTPKGHMLAYRVNWRYLFYAHGWQPDCLFGFNILMGLPLSISLSWLLVQLCN
jgi:hypothetical protein